MQSILLQEPVAEPSALMQFLPLILIMVIFYFFMMRPQQKKQKQMEEMRSALKKGDSVTTASGLIARVSEIKEDRVVLEIQNGVCATFDKSAIVSVNTK